MLYAGQLLQWQAEKARRDALYDKQSAAAYQDIRDMAEGRYNASGAFLEQTSNFPACTAPLFVRKFVFPDAVPMHAQMMT